MQTGRCLDLCQFSRCDFFGFDGNQCGARCDVNCLENHSQFFYCIPNYFRKRTVDMGVRKFHPFKVFKNCPVLVAMLFWPCFSHRWPGQTIWNSCARATKWWSSSVQCWIPHGTGDVHVQQSISSLSNWTWSWRVCLPLDGGCHNRITHRHHGHRFPTGPQQFCRREQTQCLICLCHWRIRPLSILWPNCHTTTGYDYTINGSICEFYLSGFFAGCPVKPLTVDQVSFMTERDTRAGFFNHPVLNVTWCPTSCELAKAIMMVFMVHIIIQTRHRECITLHCHQKRSKQLCGRSVWDS